MPIISGNLTEVGDKLRARTHLRSQERLSIDMGEQALYAPKTQDICDLFILMQPHTINHLNLHRNYLVSEFTSHGTVNRVGHFLKGDKYRSQAFLRLKRIFEAMQTVQIEKLTLSRNRLERLSRSELKSLSKILYRIPSLKNIVIDNDFPTDKKEALMAHAPQPDPAEISTYAPHL